MSDKQMHIKVQFNDWDNLDQYKKNFINFIMKDIVVDVAYDSDTDYNCWYLWPDYLVGEESRPVIYYAWTDDVDYSTGLVRTPVTLREWNSEQPIVQCDVIPYINGTENVDQSVTPKGMSESDYVGLPCTNCKDQYEFQLRSSSFGIRVNNEMHSVHYKIGLLPLRFGGNYVPVRNSNPTIDDLKNKVIDETYGYNDDVIFHLSADSNGYTSYLFNNSLHFDKLPARFVQLIQSDEEGYYDGLMYLELCHDETGESFSELYLNEFTELYVRETADSEWEAAYYWNNTVIALTTTDKHLTDHTWIYTSPIIGK